MFDSLQRQWYAAGFSKSRWTKKWNAWAPLLANTGDQNHVAHILQKISTKTFNALFIKIHLEFVGYIDII